MSFESLSQGTTPLVLQLQVDLPSNKRRVCSFVLCMDCMQGESCTHWICVLCRTITIKNCLESSVLLDVGILNLESWM